MAKPRCNNNSLSWQTCDSFPRIVPSGEVCRCAGVGTEPRVTAATAECRLPSPTLHHEHLLVIPRLHTRAAAWAQTPHSGCCSGPDSTLWSLPPYQLQVASCTGLMSYCFQVSTNFHGTQYILVLSHLEREY